MRTCASCGFENAQEGQSCSLCGASEVRYSELSSEAPTLAMAETLRQAEPPGIAPLRRSLSLPAGHVFASRYTVLHLLGSGGMGEVYRVRDERDGRERALKRMRGADESDPERGERFRREISVLTRIRHPAVLPILDWGASSDEQFFVSELIDGCDLKLAIQQRGPWPLDEACAVVATLCDALAAAHALGIVHRDVKPNNVMLGADGSVRLLDFGLARGHGVGMSSLTRTGVIVGTPAYMSPEQFDGRPVDERSDVYALGAVLFELLTAELPFQAPNAMALAVKHLVEPAPSPRQRRAELPAWVERVVLRCLEKDPARRYPTALALRAELETPRSGGRLRSRRLASGDLALEEPGGEWALVLASPGEKTGWTPGLALRFEERFYRLEAILPPPEPSGRFTYRFSSWPSEIVLRTFVDYERDVEERRGERGRSLSARVSRLFGRGE